MITHSAGNLLDSSAQALVNPVNCVGVMGAGLAAQFKTAYPANFLWFANLCSEGLVQPGHVYPYNSSVPDTPTIINFPTKYHWAYRSKLDYISRGLHSLAEFIEESDPASMAVPALGCGKGGLAWVQVLPLIERILGDLPRIEITIYDPHEEAAPRHVKHSRR